MEKKENSKDVEDLKKRLITLEKSIAELKNLLIEKQEANAFSGKIVKTPSQESEGSRIIKGFFDGEKMHGEDGYEYEIPANYASKSKLVEGDVLKLTITSDGSFVYKQIGPVERRKVIGILTVDDNGHHKITTPEKSYRVLLASVTYFKAQPGDQITLVVPKDRECVWGAIENVVQRTMVSGTVKEVKALDLDDEISLEDKPKKEPKENIEEIKVPFLKEDSDIEDLDDLDNNRSTFTI